MSAVAQTPHIGSSEPYRFKCAIPGCDARFRNEALYRRHTIRCSESVDDLVQARIAERDANIFTGINDKEQYAWLRREK